MKLTDLPKYGHLPAPEPHRSHTATRLRERCPECGRGTVLHLSDDPRDVRFKCSRHCGWDA